jgi:hypothetical protein
MAISYPSGDSLIMLKASFSLYGKIGVKDATNGVFVLVGEGVVVGEAVGVREGKGVMEGLGVRD